MTVEVKDRALAPPHKLSSPMAKENGVEGKNSTSKYQHEKGHDPLQEIQPPPIL
jgi:hypothetical protein